MVLSGRAGDDSQRLIIGKGPKAPPVSTQLKQAALEPRKKDINKVIKTDNKQLKITIYGVHDYWIGGAVKRRWGHRSSREHTGRF